MFNTAKVYTPAPSVTVDVRRCAGGSDRGARSIACAIRDEPSRFRKDQQALAEGICLRLCGGSSRSVCSIREPLRLLVMSEDRNFEQAVRDKAHHSDEVAAQNE
jgi:hypothetical protein